MDALMSLTARLTEKFPSSRVFFSAAWVDWAVLAPTVPIKAMAPTSMRVRTFTRVSLSPSGECPPMGQRLEIACCVRCPRTAEAACQILRTDRKTESAVSVDYVERVNRAIDHVVSNLAQPLRLEEVSKAAGFSPFHFHRVFKAFLGETLNQFVKRQRLERALFLMSHAPQRSLTDLALDCGFSSSSDFSRSFKQHYGLPPSVFDLETFRNFRREELERVLSSQNGSPRITTLPAG